MRRGLLIDYYYCTGCRSCEVACDIEHCLLYTSPWLAIYLAVSFGVYGAIKKKGGYPAVEAIAVESAVMTPRCV